MDEELRMRIGDSDTLQMDVRLFADEQHPRCLAWGDILVSLNGEPVWCTESEKGDEAPVTWAWIDLLEFLGDKWPWLILEDQYPIPINPLHPGSMRRDAEKRWESMPEEAYLDEDETLFRFEARHDLAMGLKGIFLPPLFLLRQGEKVWVCTKTLRHLIAFEGVRAILTTVGNCLTDYIGADRDHRASRAAKRWLNREERVKDLFWKLRTGLSEELRTKLEQGQRPADFWETSGVSDDYDNELLAVARLSAGVVGIEDQRAILDRIKKSPKREIGTLDEVARKVAGELDEHSRPYEQGYALAQTLRGDLGVSPDKAVDPEDVVDAWGVAIEEIALNNCPLDAVAAWGPRHGPVIILNIGAGGRASHAHGRRSTLAHEIGHLLVDRSGALPFSEVLGGHTPLYVEQRARAFAAEFLLPKDSAVNTVRNSASLEEGIELLSRYFEVSVELAALQIKNSSLFFDLSEEEKGIISRNTEATGACQV